MNEIHPYQIVINLDIWQPFEKQANWEIDKLIADIKAKKLLGSCGNVRLHIQQGTK